VATIYNIEYRAVGVDSLLHVKHEHFDCFEIIQTWYNRGFVTIKDKVYPMEWGSIYFINAIETHCTNPECPNEYVRNKLFISGEYMLSLAAAAGMSDVVKELFLDGGGTSCSLDYGVAETVDSLFRNIWSLYVSDSKMKIPLISSDIIRLISIIQCNKKDVVYKGNHTIDKTIAYINENISEKITIDDICKELHINKYYLCHLFKKITNMSIFEYIRERRLSIAKKLLISDFELPISEIAMRSGFSSFSYFNQTFKIYTGMTPGDYRDKYKFREM